MEVRIVCHNCGKKFTLEPEAVQHGTTIIVRTVGSTKPRQVTCPHCGASNMVSAPEGIIRREPETITRLEP